MYLILIFGIVLLAILLILSFTDIKEFRLPDKWTFPLILLGLIQAYALGLDLRAHLIGAALGYAIFFAIEQIYKVIRGKAGLGRGDAKLLAAGGAWCGWFALPFIIFIASMSALSAIFAQMLTRGLTLNDLAKLKLPFGPFLAIGIIMTWYALIAHHQIKIL